MSKRNPKDVEKLEALDRLIEEITIDAYGYGEQLWAFQQAFESYVPMPADGFVIGEPVSVVAVDYGGNERRGLTAKCRREDGYEYVVGASEVTFSCEAAGARYIAAYRRFLGLDPYPTAVRKGSLPPKQHKAADGDIDLGKPVEIVALGSKGQAFRCLMPESKRIITLRARSLWKVVPGAVVTVMPRKQWRYSGHPYLSGDILSVRIDAKAIGLTPLELEDMGIWDPREEYWGEDDVSALGWAGPIDSFGPRPMFEMEQVLPGEDPDDPSDDPITRSIDLNAAGEREEAVKILMELCRADLRCLDAHSHLGALDFDNFPGGAVRNYEVGLRIGELSLGDDFNGVLPWDLIDNRPFLRCMHGYGLCLWRLGRFDEAEGIFQKMLWMNPCDNQGVRFLIGDVKAKAAWEDRESK